MTQSIAYPHLNGKPRSPTPAEVAQALTGRDYLSYSQVSTFQACTLKWHFAYVEQAKPESVPAAMLVGSSIHAAIQHHLECQMSAEQQPSIDDLIAVFQRRWKEEGTDVPIAYSRDEDEQSQADLARRMLTAYLDSPYSQIKGVTLGIEETLRVSLHPELPDLLARVDHIAGVNQQLVVTDFKTARSMWSNDTADEHSEQLHLYAVAAQTIAEDLKFPVSLRFVILTKAKTPKVEAIQITADPKRVERSTLIIRNVFRAMQSGVVYPSPSTMNCSGCPFSKRCKKWHGQ